MMNSITIINSGVLETYEFENEEKYKLAVSYIQSLIQGSSVSATFDAKFYGKPSKICLTAGFVKNSAFILE